MNLSLQQVTDFQKIVLNHYHQSGRHGLAWRQSEANGDFDPYKILVSELMLQQTQVSRVSLKFNKFLELFPTVEALSQAPLAAVLTTWNGLGYNRRAKFLHQAAKMIVANYHGVFPSTIDELIKLPGVGRNTAGALLAYAFNQPVAYVETNIRTVYFHHFLNDQEIISDGEVVVLVEQTIDSSDPRQWYWALMDYGAFLKASGMKLNMLSKHHTKQSKFEGSKRQIRGKIVRSLTVQDLTQKELQASIPDDRLPQVITDLLNEGLLSKKTNYYHLSN